MTFTDLERLYQLLGPKGTIAGLHASDVRQELLREVASKAKLTVSDQVSRDELIEILVSCLVETKHILRHPPQNVNSNVYETELKFGKSAPVGQAQLRRQIASRGGTPRVFEAASMRPDGAVAATSLDQLGIWLHRDCPFQYRSGDR
jgi:hypothetical protein